MMKSTLMMASMAGSAMFCHSSIGDVHHGMLDHNLDGARGRGISAAT